MGASPALRTLRRAARHVPDVAWLEPSIPSPAVIVVVSHTLFCQRDHGVISARAFGVEQRVDADILVAAGIVVFMKLGRPSSGFCRFMRFPWVFGGGFWPENCRDRMVFGVGNSSTSFDQPDATMRYLLTAAMTMAMLTGPAYSQFNPNGQSKDPLTLK